MDEPVLTEGEIKRQLRHYFKLWYKGGHINGSLKSKLDHLLFYKDWQVAGITTHATRHKTWLVKKYKVCQHCGSDKNLTQDHIIPLARGGKNGLHNKQLLCASCNKKKGKTVPNANDLARRDLSAIPTDGQ